MIEYIKTLEKKLSMWQVENLVHDNSINITYVTVPIDVVSKMISDLKKDPDTKYTILTDITAVDYPENEKRFQMIWNLLSIYNNHRLVIKANIDEGEDVNSIVSIYKAATWYEREVFDMFGVKFVGNHDLRRILTDYGFNGYPLRKDFPVTGHVECRYDEKHGKVIYEPVHLMQDYRKFDFESPWMGPEYVLPGDEKASKG